MRHLNNYEEGQTVDVCKIREAEKECEEAGEDHPQGEEVSKVHPLRQKPGPEHEEGVGEEVGRVQHAEVRLRLLLLLSVDCRDP